MRCRPAPHCAWTHASNVVAVSSRARRGRPGVAEKAPPRPRGTTSINGPIHGHDCEAATGPAGLAVKDRPRTEPRPFCSRASGRCVFLICWLDACEVRAIVWGANWQARPPTLSRPRVRAANELAGAVSRFWVAPRSPAASTCSAGSRVVTGFVVVRQAPRPLAASRRTHQQIRSAPPGSMPYSRGDLARGDLEEPSVGRT